MAIEHVFVNKEMQIDLFNRLVTFLKLFVYKWKPNRHTHFALAH